jgi:plastocyanin
MDMVTGDRMVTRVTGGGGARACALSVVALTTSFAFATNAAPAPTTADGERWLADELPLPLTVKTPQDIGFKSAVERQYLIFNLMAAGKLAYQRGDFATAVAKWDVLLRIGGLDPQIEKAVAPFLTDARSKAPGGRPGDGQRGTAAIAAPPPASSAAGGGRRATSAGMTMVGGTVSGGGQIGPGGAVVWLKRLDGTMPRTAPVTDQVITQREKTFLPHVLAVPLGSTVEFRNDDRIYHNVFSIAKPNDFDAGIRKTGATYTRTFTHPGVVEILCNIHSSMNAYVYVVDSPYFAKAQASGAFSIRGVPPGRYELGAWHEAASAITRKAIVVGPEGARDVAVTVGNDRRAGPFVPDKYGHKRQPQLGY